MSKAFHAVEPATQRSEATAPASGCRSMAELRAQIDRIDRAIIALLAERAGFVRQAAHVKRRREEIVDPERIEEVVAKVRRTAAEHGLEPALAEAAYRLLIERFIALEAEEFERRGAPPSGAT